MLRLIVAFLLSYALVVLLAWVFQSRLLYLRSVPGRDFVATPADAGMSFETVRPVTDDGVKLHGWLVPAEGERGTLLFLHGNAGNISHRLDSIRIFHELGLAVLIVDYRGYGRSEGSPSEAGTRLDARAAWQFLVAERGIDPERIVVFGRSLGAAVAAELCREVTPGALILESAFTSVPEIAQEAYWFLPARWLSRFEYATAEYVRSVDSPLLVIHSEDDEIIPYSHGRRVFESAREPKRLVTLHGDHNTGFLLSRPIYERAIDSFLKETAGLAPR